MAPEQSEMLLGRHVGQLWVELGEEDRILIGKTISKHHKTDVIDQLITLVGFAHTLRHPQHNASPPPASEAPRDRIASDTTPLQSSIEAPKLEIDLEHATGETQNMPRPDASESQQQQATSQILVLQEPYSDATVSFIDTARHERETKPGPSNSATEALPKVVQSPLLSSGTDNSSTPGQAAVPTTSTSDSADVVATSGAGATSITANSTAGPAVAVTVPQFELSSTTRVQGLEFKQAQEIQSMALFGNFSCGTAANTEATVSSTTKASEQLHPKKTSSTRSVATPTSSSVTAPTFEEVACHIDRDLKASQAAVTDQNSATTDRGGVDTAGLRNQEGSFLDGLSISSTTTQPAREGLSSGSSVVTSASGNPSATTASFPSSGQGGLQSTRSTSVCGGTQVFADYPGTDAVAFKPYLQSEPGSFTSSLQNILFQEPYVRFSAEELRMADYEKGHRFGNGLPSDSSALDNSRTSATTSGKVSFFGLSSPSTSTPSGLHDVPKSIAPGQPQLTTDDGLRWRRCVNCNASYQESNNPAKACRRHTGEFTLSGTYALVSAWHRLVADSLLSI
ncbi:hypothetical protein VPNG_10376 [Cytospora leucostoma]|uniref:Uncharacterized protein n=1 Tax=Cytospora leucostoma TaxID=1230097 RepID=A0A423VC59_9PEZI|nr:hypothetical protein VPNG_10376 [Cytospora leucostoma]